MMVTICKEFTFDAAHFLPDHPGKCKHLHGHTYGVQVKLRGKVNPGSGTEMLVDFYDIKTTFEQVVMCELDHKILNDVVPVVPTAENLAAWILCRLRLRIPEVYAVRVYESPTNYAEVTCDDIDVEDVLNVQA